MGIKEVEISFAFRASEYFIRGQLNEFLNFHYEHYCKYNVEPAEWLNNVKDLYFIVERYRVIPYLRYLKIRKQVKDWIAEKRQELAELDCETVTMGESAEATEHSERTKLNWGGSNSALYELFAQLSQRQTRNGKLVLDYTPKHLATFLKGSFEGLPSLGNIQREIQKYRKDAEKAPPKDGVDLSSIDF